MTINVNNNNNKQQQQRCRCRFNSRNSYDLQEVANSSDLHEVANVLIYLSSLVSKDACFFRRMNCINNNSNRQQRPLLELALRLLREIAVTTSSSIDDDGDDEKDDIEDNIEPAAALIRKIEQNEVSHLILRNVRLFDSSRNSRIHTNMADNLSSQSPALPPSSSSYWNFDEGTVQQAAEALKSNNSIRSISCQYDFNNNNFSNLASLAAAGRQRYYPRMITSSSTTTATSVSGTNKNHSIIVSTRRRNYIHEQQHRRRQQPINNNMHSNNNNNNTNYNVVSRQREHSFIEACICLPRLESLSLTGNNRWRISHLCQILETVKGLKRLTIRDVVVRSKIELYNLQRCLLRLKKQRIVGGGGAGIPLEEIDLTIEDQTEWYNNNSSSSGRNFRDRKKKQSHYCDESCCSSCSCSYSCSSSLFDGLLEILITNIPNLQIISITKSILSRLNILLRPISVDISTTTLIKLTKYSSLSKLKLVGLSFERYSIESMCKLLIKQHHKERNNSNNNRNHRRQQHHITHLEFTGCAFNHTVSQSDWNALFHLIQHDPNIQIIASSVIYHRVHVRQQQHYRYNSCSSCDEQNIDNNNSIRYNEQQRLGEGGSSTIQRPHHDFLFSLRDKDGTNRHFCNRGMEIEYILQEAGFFRLLQQRGEGNGGRRQHRPRRRSTIMDWIDVMVKVKDDAIALFYILRENPALCAVSSVLN